MAFTHTGYDPCGDLVAAREDRSSLDLTAPERRTLQRLTTRDRSTVGALLCGDPAVQLIARAEAMLQSGSLLGR